jgi:Bacterial alpha-L-rhamnosidase C-terminal domain
MALVFDVANSSYVSSISQQLTTNWNAVGAVAPELPNNIVGYVQSFEIKGHLAARQATRALDLIRLSWGWYLNNPYGTASTCIEGYLSDGTFGYRSTTGYDNDSSYTSHAHGWSTGPTDALTSYILGLTLTQPAGSQWQLAPQFGDLTHAEGGFTTPLGKFSANWTLIEGGYTISWETPGGTVGVLVLPPASGSKSQPIVELDGKSMALQIREYDSGTGLTTVKTTGGTHTARVMSGRSG